MLKGTTCMRTSFIKSVSLLCIFSVTVAFLNRQIRESRLFINKFMLKNNFVEFLVFLPMILFCSVQFIQLSQQMGPYPISNEVCRSLLKFFTKFQSRAYMGSSWWKNHKCQLIIKCKLIFQKYKKLCLFSSIVTSLI